MLRGLRIVAFGAALGLALTALAEQGIRYRESTSSQAKPNHYRVKVKFPVLLADDPAAKRLADLANRTIRTEAERRKAIFLQEFLKSSRPSGQPEWMLDLDFQNGVLRPRLVSTLLEIHEYAGGAHGSWSYAFMNFGIVAGKPVHLKLAHLFRTRIDPLSVVSRMVIARLKNRPEAPYVLDGGVKTLTAKQAEQFRVTPRGLEFVFAPYEMAPFAAGTIRCSLNWAELKAHLDPNGPLKGLF